MMNWRKLKLSVGCMVALALLLMLVFYHPLIGGVLLAVTPMAVLGFIPWFDWVRQPDERG